jgi:DNA-binding MarR family transcriptional regulator
LKENMAAGHDIPMALRAAYLSMHRQTNAHLAKSGVTADQFVCLLLLAEQDGITQQELVRRATSDPNTIRAMLVLMEERGFVTRKPHPSDGRARRVTITPKGRQICEKLFIEVQPIHDRLSTLFKDDEAKMLVLSLQNIFEAMI